MFKVKYVDSIMMLVRLELNPIVSLFQHKCEVSETVSTTTLDDTVLLTNCVYGIDAQYYPNASIQINKNFNWVISQKVFQSWHTHAMKIGRVYVSNYSYWNVWIMYNA